MLRDPSDNCTETGPVEKYLALLLGLVVVWKVGCLDFGDATVTRVNYAWLALAECGQPLTSLLECTVSAIHHDACSIGIVVE